MYVLEAELKAQGLAILSGFCLVCHLESKVKRLRTDKLLLLRV